jgi:hypothetical protein
LPKLRDTQKEFLEKLRGEKAEGRLRIYQNNRNLILRDVLKGVYPVTAALLGDKFTDFACHEFGNAFPPQSADMNAFGAGFADFLSYIPAVRDFPYVPDVARLEWAAHESYLAPAHAALKAEDLEKVEDPLNMRLFLQPHVFLLRSGWPVDKLWARVTREGAGLKGFEMAPQETFLAIYREGNKAAVWSLGEGAYVFFEYLHSSPVFAFAAEAALRADSTLPLDTVLAAGVLAEIFRK